MKEVLAAAAVIQNVCDQLSDDKDLATGEVMAAAAIVAVTAGLNDDQAVNALRSGLKAVRDVDAKAVH